MPWHMFSHLARRRLHRSLEVRLPAARCRGRESCVMVPGSVYLVLSDTVGLHVGKVLAARFGCHEVAEDATEEQYRDADTQRCVNADLLNSDRQQERADG